MKLAWLTDIHLNFLEHDERAAFYNDILNTHCDAVLVSGDIAEAPCLTNLMREMANHLARPIYFILGNHDYYRGTIHVVRDALSSLTKTHEHLFWLPASGIQLLTKDTILLGQDGWADGRLGDYQNSRISLNDSRMIADLFQEKILGKSHLVEKMQQLADLDATALQHDLDQAITQRPKKIIVLTHVPPFKEACMHQGQISDDNWLPYFSSKVVGDVLMQVANDNPSIEFLVFCGHTHSEACFQPSANLIVKAGKAEYYQPEVQEMILI